MKFSLRSTMLMFGLGIAIFPMLVIILLVWVMNVDIKNITNSEYDKIAQKTSRQIIEDVILICKVIEDTQNTEDIKAGSIFKDNLSNLGNPNLSEETQTILVASQITPMELTEVNLPTLSFGDNKILFEISPYGNIYDSYGNVNEVLNNLKKDTGLDFAILQRIDEQGNMLRVASTVVDADSYPYIGTYLPASGGYDDGLIVRTLLARKSYSGMSRTGTISFIANYEPILDENGEVIGAISYGRTQSTISYLLKYFEDIRIGTNGSVWAVELVGNGESVIRVSKDGKQNGRIVEGDSNKVRRETYLELISSALTQGDGTVSVREYKLGDDVDDLIASYTYFKPWNMVIGTALYRSDFKERSQKIIDSTNDFMRLFLPLGLALLLFVGIGILVASNRAVYMTSVISSAVVKIKRGEIKRAQTDLTKIIDPKKWSNREIYDLSVAMQTMTLSLAELISKVQDSSNNLVDSSAKISSGVNEIHKSTQERSDTLSEILNTINSISKSVISLNADSKVAAESIDKSIELASGGSNLLSRLNDNALSLLSAADSVQARLAVIKDKTERIITAVDTINVVTQKTNMLSLNASIEAERNMVGKDGFKIVADEISKLADRTAVSAMSVSQMVANMESSVDSGISNIVNFSVKMKSSSHIIAKIDKSLSSVEEHIAELSPKFEYLANSIESQEDDSINIAKLMHSLDNLALLTRNKVAQLNVVTTSLEQTSDTLSEKSSRL